MKAYEIITDRIIEALEKGTVPWRKPWKASLDAPRSLASKRPYRGINVFMLAMTAAANGYSSPYWATYNQIKKLGGNVRKGEKSTPVVLWKVIEREKDGEKQSFPMLRYFNVFNVEQAEGIEVPSLDAETFDFDPHSACEEIIESFLADGGPSFANGGNSAHYEPLRDHVQMPEPEQFVSSASYYATLFHELGHSTGHKSRLDRQFSRFGSGPYSREELVAEMTACFLLSEAGMDIELDQSAAYIKSWLKVLREDNRAVVMAATAAQKAADMVLGRQAEEESDLRSPATAGVRSSLLRHQQPRRNHVQHSQREGSHRVPRQVGTRMAPDHLGSQRHREGLLRPARDRGLVGRRNGRRVRARPRDPSHRPERVHRCQDRARRDRAPAGSGQPQHPLQLMTMQQEIRDLVLGKHKDWHLQSLLTRTYGELGWEYHAETQWEFVAGFDYEQDAVIAKADCERSVREGLQYGGDDYELRVVPK